MAEGCCQSESVKSWFRAPLLHLWSVYVLYYWGENMWQFALGLYLVYLEEGILRLAAIFGFSAAGAVLLFGGLLGSWVDRSNRLKAMQVSILVQDIAVVIFSIIVFLVVRYEDDVMTTWSGGLWTLLSSIIIMFSIIAQLFGMTFKISLERDWFVVVADGDTALLARINSVTRTLDQVCMLLAPLVAGQIMTHVSLQVAALIIAAYSGVTVCIKYVLILKLYNHVPQLARSKQNTEHSPEDESLNDPGPSHSVPINPKPSDKESENNMLMKKWPQSHTDGTGYKAGDETNKDVSSDEKASDESPEVLESSNQDITMNISREDDVKSDVQEASIECQSGKSENHEIHESEQEDQTQNGENTTDEAVAAKPEGSVTDGDVQETDNPNNQDQGDSENNTNCEGREGDQVHDNEDGDEPSKESLVNGVNLLVSNSNISVKSGQRGSGCIHSVFEHLLVLYTGWKVYARQKVVLAGIGLAFLYMTVLAFDTVTVGYAYANGISESSLGILTAIAGVSGILGSVLYPIFRTKLGLERTGILGFWFEIGCLTLPLISIWLPGSPFDPGYLQSDHVTEPNGCSPTTHAPTVIPYLANGSENVVVVTGGAVVTSCVEVTSSVVTPSIVVFLIGILLSRIGLWVTDLTIAQLFQENVPEKERGVVNGVQNSLNMIFEITKYILVIILPYVQTYGILVILSYVFVFIGGVMFLVFCWKTNRKALGCQDGGSLGGGYEQKIPVESANV